MAEINLVTIQHINALSDIQLSQVLHALLLAEAEKYKLSDFDRSVPFNITTGDGGSDGRLFWTGAPSKTPRLKNCQTIFQNKATDLIPSKCYEEILEPEIKGQPRQLKSEINKIVDAKGSYILFTNHSIVDMGKSNRISEFRRAIKDVGKANFAEFNIEIFDANTIKDWVNEYLNIVLMVQRFNGVDRPAGFRDWNALGIDIAANEVPYQLNEVNEGYIQSIQSSIEAEKVIRIIGHSGIGKTRLIYEAFRSSDTTSLALQQKFVYYDVGKSENAGEIFNYIISHRSHQSGIIVVDNCDVNTHIKLSGVCKPQGELLLITIGLDDSKSVDDIKIKLDRDDQRDIVREIVQQQLSVSHSSSDIEYITNLSEGYPWMAVRFSRLIQRNGITEFDKFLPEDFLQKLLFGTNTDASNELDYEIIRACSVFSAFGFLDDSFLNVINPEYRQSLQAQMDFIKDEVCDAAVTATKFKSTCNKFLKEDIIEKRGTYYIVKPTVLAIHLAAQWLIDTPVEKIKDIIEKLKVVKLEKQFLERLTDLDQLDKAKDIIEELFGPKSFFGTAEALNTSWGSLLFRYMVEVNPSATAAALDRVYGNADKVTYSLIVEGRRNLVWALEKLVFHREVFVESAKILFGLAVGENEAWANNATNQISQLFQRYLAGTEASYEERLPVLKWALAKSDPDYTRIAIKCINKAFIPDGNHIRNGGAEKQGKSAPLVDYIPKNFAEIQSYWEELMQILTSIAIGNGEIAELAKKSVVASIRTLVNSNLPALAIDAVREIVQMNGSPWLDALSEFKKSLAYNRNLLKDDIEIIEHLIHELTPQTLHDQLALKIVGSEIDYQNIKNRKENLIDSPREKAEAFADYLVNEQIEWLDEISFLLSGEQKQTINFGKRIGQIHPSAQNILENAFKVLVSLPKEKQNPSLIIGILLGIDNHNLFQIYLDHFVNEPKIAHHSFSILRLFNADIVDFNKLFQLIDNNILKISSFDNLRFGSSFAHFEANEIDIFCQRVASYGLSGKWTALSLLSMYCFDNNEKWKAHRVILRQLISSDNLLLGQEINTLEPYDWTTSVIKLIDDTNDLELAVIITSQLIEFCEDSNFNYGFESYLEEVFRVLFKYYLPTIGEIIKNGLIKDSITYMHLKSFIGSHNGSNGKQGVLFEFPQNYEQIYDLCAFNDKMVLRIAYMMPIMRPFLEAKNEQGGLSNSNKIEWHTFTKGFLDRYGNNEKVLNELSANMASFGWMGSSVPYYEIQKQLLAQLVNHPFLILRNWAKKMLRNTEKTIKVEKLNDEQQFLN